MSLLYKIIGNTLNVCSHISPKATAKLALSLFSTPFKGKKYTKNQKQFLATAKTKFLNHQGTVIATYLWPGKKQTVLLVHGWESNSSRWQKLTALLQEQDYKIVALDAPAHGQSGGKQFNAILYAEFIHKVVNYYNPQIIIGHSVGGMATVFYQHKYQNPSLKKLVLLGAPSNFTNIFERYVTLMGYNKKIDLGMKQLVFKKYGNYPAYYSAAKFSEKITIPGLLIHDTNDAIIPYQDARNYLQHYKKASLFTTTGFGHSLNQQKVSQQILQFIAK